MYKRRKTNKKSFARKVKRIITNLDETKFISNAIVSNGVNPVGVTDTWNDISGVGVTNFPLFGDRPGAANTGIIQGTGASNRIGNRVKMKACIITVQVKPTVGATMFDGASCRFVVVKDKLSSGVAPSADAIFQTVNSGVSQIARPYNLANVSTTGQGAGTKRFSILLDKVHQMVVTGTSTANNVLAAGPQLVAIYKIPVKGLEVEYSASTSAVADLQKNHLWFFFVGEASACCSLSVNVQNIYTDM